MRRCTWTRCAARYVACPGPLTRAWFRAKSGAPDRRVTITPLPALVVPLSTIYADLDNDGRADRVLINRDFNGHGVASFQHGDGVGGFGAQAEVGTVDIPSIGSPYGGYMLDTPTSVRDLDGDGRLPDPGRAEDRYDGFR